MQIEHIWNREERVLRVFVYGTLLSGDSNHHIVQPYVNELQAGTVRGTLYDLGAYPALVPNEEGSLVEGEWLTIDLSGLPVLDELEDYYGPGEDNEYERIWIQDAQRPEVAGWIYVYLNAYGLTRIPSGSWRKRRQNYNSGGP
jgi:gamma-glutamylcyclotransferase (GGCT)/AIG2-like uncharacterized protein YtfP